MVLRGLCRSLLLLALTMDAAMALDFLPSDHGLRYVGRAGIVPVTVEVTLHERPGGVLEYVEWVTPRSWASWLRSPTYSRARLRFQNDVLELIDVDTGDGARPPPEGPVDHVLDRLSIRLRARADIARGLVHAEYTVWNGDHAHETWTLDVSGTETVQTPDGSYDTLRFRLGSDSQWIEGWSAPLLVFHFVKIDSWRDGKKTAELGLDDKQL